jgi:hypothetical protein
MDQGRMEVAVVGPFLIMFLAKRPYNYSCDGLFSVDHSSVK